LVCCVRGDGWGAAVSPERGVARWIAEGGRPLGQGRGGRERAPGRRAAGAFRRTERGAQIRREERGRPHRGGLRSSRKPTPHAARMACPASRNVRGACRFRCPHVGPSTGRAEASAARRRPCWRGLMFVWERGHIRPPCLRASPIRHAKGAGLSTGPFRYAVLCGSGYCSVFLRRASRSMPRLSSSLPPRASRRYWAPASFRRAVTS